MRLRLKKPLKLGKKGQTSVEYILIIVVMVTMVGSILKKVEDWMINNPDSQLNALMSFVQFDPDFKTFVLRR